GISGVDAVGRASVEVPYGRPSAPPIPAAPGVTVDTAPTASFAEPFDGEAVVGESFVPTVSASDDFGVRSVELTLDAEAPQLATLAPYEFGGGWRPDYDEIGQTHTLSARVVDSAGNETVVTGDFEVVAPAGYEAAQVDADALDAGSVLLGATADRTVTVTNSGENPVTLTALDLSGTGFAPAGGSCVAGAELAVGESCTVTVRFAPTVAGAASGTLSIPYTAIGAGAPLAVTLGGTGVTPEPERREPEQREPETRQPETPAVVPPVTPDPPVTPVTPPSAQPTPAAALAVTFPRAVKASRSGVLTLATLRNSGTAAGTVRVTGTLVVGRARFAIRVTSRVAAGKRVTLSVRLSRRARLALRRRGGTLSLRVTGVGARALTRRITVRRG
ncbi:MAG TPA: choice-of-anchor D domain-containing protein, partial [Conexibacter sp.]|nr:choice-of-anchor D domain-containing protein [Conexibacter sp.]